MKKCLVKISIFVMIFILSFLFSAIVGYGATNSKKPPTPVLTQDIKKVTDTSINVTINNWGNAEIKEYKIDNSDWMKYTSTIKVDSNVNIFARGRNSSGLVSDTGKLEIKNIRKLLNKVDVSEHSILTVKIVVYDINDNELGNGSGFIISSDGLVVTNYHVIDMIPKMKVITSDNKTYDVSGVLAYDKNRDIAVMKLENAECLPSVTLGNSDDLKLGEDIVAIGYPLGLQTTVSFGNVSSLNVPGALLRTNFKDIQITAPISHGNSGGPLFNMYGEVVGINYSVIDGAQNINYSIPVNELKPMLNSKQIKKLSDVIKEVYPSMSYTEYSKYFYYNYPDCKSDEYIFSFSDVTLDEPSKYPDGLVVYLDLNQYKYADILFAELEGNKQLAEKWMDEIYNSIKLQYPDKDVCIVVGLYGSFNIRPDGYSDQEVLYNSGTNTYDVYRQKVIYFYEGNTSKAVWY
jgi:S1-C subfamily serine protease